MLYWYENYERFLKIKNMIIVYGNIYDYINYKNKYIRINDYISKNLSLKNRVIKYDVLNGIEFINLSEKEIFNLLENYDNKKYSFVDNKITINTNSLRTRRMPGDNFENSVNINLNLDIMENIKEEFYVLDNFFKLIYKNSDTKNNIIYLIEITDAIFGKIRPDDRFAINEKYIFNYVYQSIIKFNNQKLIFLAKDINTLPKEWYLKNPKSGVVKIPLPNINQREEFYYNNIKLFNIDKKYEKNFIDDLDGFTLTEMYQIALLSSLSENQDYKNIISEFKYGTKRNAWTELRSEKLSKFNNIIEKRVKGQNNAINKVGNILIKAYTEISGIQYSLNNKKPKGILFFVGPTGVGKTELAKSIAEFIFGDENSCIRFDMSEYSAEHSDQKLIGAPPGYIGYEIGGQLTNKIKENPFSVILFDEIEKSHNKILDKFLQILEDGRLTDGKGETVNFSETLIIFTSNIGTNNIDYKDENIEDKLKNFVIHYFNNELNRPEILNRIGIDNIIVFDFIKDDNLLKDIVLSKLKNINKLIYNKYNKSELIIRNENKIILDLVSKSNRNYGARGVLNDMEKYLITPLSKFLFKNKIIEQSKIIANYNEDKNEFEFKIYNTGEFNE